MQYSTIAIFIVVHTIHYFLQLFRIFRLLGTPNEAIWPGVTHLQDFNSSFPNWDAPTEFANILPDLKVIFVEHVFIKIIIKRGNPIFIINPNYIENILLGKWFSV